MQQNYTKKGFWTAPLARSPFFWIINNNYNYKTTTIANIIHSFVFSFRSYYFSLFSLQIEMEKHILQTRYNLWQNSAIQGPGGLREVLSLYLTVCHKYLNGNRQPFIQFWISNIRVTWKMSEWQAFACSIRWWPAWQEHSMCPKTISGSACIFCRMQL